MAVIISVLTMINGLTYNWQWFRVWRKPFQSNKLEQCNRQEDGDFEPNLLPRRRGQEEPDCGYTTDQATREEQRQKEEQWPSTYVHSVDDGGVDAVGVYVWLRHCTDACEEPLSVLLVRRDVSLLCA